MVVATGFFDGVHIGHRLVIDQLVSAARDCGDESLVVTFWPHPRNVLQKEAASLRFLTSLDEKRQRLAGLGVDHVEVIDFTREFSRLSAREYLQQYVIDRFGGTTVVFGYDNRIGHEGTGEDIIAVAKELGLKVIVAPMASSGADIAVSSSWIRSMIEAGNVEMASRMLGYDYPLLGVVVSGERIGRAMGFPTANMQLYEPLKLIPCNGVYLVAVHTLGRDYFGMCNIGNRPTVREGNARTVETNIFDFDEDIYGLDIKVTFLKRIRPETRFSSMEALREQLFKDRAVCLDLLK
ncbi:MAG: riboflavin biosynthesis protein RibF [Bacteroidales bacterium]|nr:riboflavin biosynthesis protein RibF [Bacteroidales bacterium]MDE7128304.1 riboflavin biosynthesis protein RibF [Bacteroidales bacterium]